MTRWVVEFASGMAVIRDGTFKEAMANDDMESPAVRARRVERVRVTAVWGKGQQLRCEFDELDEHRSGGKK